MYEETVVVYFTVLNKPAKTMEETHSGRWSH